MIEILVWAAIIAVSILIISVVVATWLFCLSVIDDLDLADEYKAATEDLPELLAPTGPRTD